MKVGDRVRVAKRVLHFGREGFICSIDGRSRDPYECRVNIIGEAKELATGYMFNELELIKCPCNIKTCIAHRKVQHNEDRRSRKDS